MKRLSCIIVCLATLASAPAFGQQSGPARSQAMASVPKPALVKFDLDFPGGTPAELAAAIQNATGRPLNVIIPSEAAHAKFPPFKMKNVDVAQLFRALLLASHHRETRTEPSSGGPHSFYRDLFCGFQTDGDVTNDSIWYFHNDGIFPAAPSVRFYLLTPYLDRGLSADDITAAIQTAWKMLGGSTASLTFQKETKLLIAAGKPSQLNIIDTVLKTLNPKR
jgi:hypothetical protein